MFVSCDFDHYDDDDDCVVLYLILQCFTTTVFVTVYSYKQIVLHFHLQYGFSYKVHHVSFQKLLLDNIAQLPDIDDPPQVSADGQFLILDGDVPDSAPVTPPVSARSSETSPVPNSTGTEKIEDPESEA